MPTPDPALLFLAEAARRAFARPDVDLAAADPAEFALDLVPSEGPAFRLGLSDLWLQTRDLGPTQRRAALDDRLEAALHPPPLPDDPDTAARALRALLRPASSVVLPGLGALDPLLWRPALPCLVEALACDLGDSLRLLRAGDLARWGISPPDGFALGRRAARGGELSPWDPHADPPMLQLDGAEGPEPSRLLEPGWLQDQAPVVGGAPIAAAPHGRLLLVTGSEAAGRLARTAEAEYLGAPSPLSPALYRSAGRRVAPLVLPPDHPASEAVTLGHLRLAADESPHQILHAPPGPVGHSNGAGRCMRGGRGPFQVHRGEGVLGNRLGAEVYWRSKRPVHRRVVGRSGEQAFVRWEFGLEVLERRALDKQRP